MSAYKPDFFGLKRPPSPLALVYNKEYKAEQEAEMDSSRSLAATARHGPVRPLVSSSQWRRPKLLLDADADAGWHRASLAPSDHAPSGSPRTAVKVAPASGEQAAASGRSQAADSAEHQVSSGKARGSERLLHVMELATEAAEVHAVSEQEQGLLRPPLSARPAERGPLSARVPVRRTPLSAR